MTEEQLNAMVNELKNDRTELREFINNTLPDATEEYAESLVHELENNSLDLRQFIIKALED